MSLTTVFEARRTTLEKAKKALKAIGIDCKITHPRRQKGVLKVSAAEARQARRLLFRIPGGSVISAAEAAWLNCHVCGAPLSEGQWHCLKCKATVGDPHGR